MDTIEFEDPPVNNGPCIPVQICAFLEHVMIRVTYILLFLISIYITDYSIRYSVTDTCINIQLLIIFSMLFKSVNYNMGCKISKDKKTIMILTLLLFFTSNFVEVISSIYMVSFADCNDIYYFKIILNCIMLESLISLLWSTSLTIFYLCFGNYDKMQLFLVQLKQCRQEMELIYN